MIWEMQWNWMVAELARKNISSEVKDRLRAKVVQQPSLPWSQTHSIQHEWRKQGVIRVSSAKTKWFGLAPSLMAWWLVIYQSDHKQTSLRRQHQPIWLLTKVASMESLVALQANIPISFSNTLSQEEHCPMLSLPRTRCDFSGRIQSKHECRHWWHLKVPWKTMGVKAWCSEVGLPFYRVNCSEGFTEESFIGYQTLDANGKMKWVDGLLPTAMRNGGILIFDEFRSARPEIMTAWNAVGDSRRPIVGRQQQRSRCRSQRLPNIRDHESSWGILVAKMWTKQPLTDSAWTWRLNTLTPKPKSRLYASNPVNNIALARQFVSPANDLRRMKSEGILETDTSTRMLVDIMKVSNDFNMNELVEYIMLGRYQAHEMEEIRAVCRAPSFDYRLDLPLGDMSIGSGSYPQVPLVYLRPTYHS